MSADHNLLFGVLALQMDFVRKDDLIAGMNAWALAKDRPLGDILAERGALQPEHKTLLDALVAAHLAQHDGDAQKSLAALSSLGSVREDFERLADPDIQASLGHVGTTRIDERETRKSSVPEAGQPTSGGLRFRILRPHAEGGLGRVSVALDNELNREVALKEIKPKHADDKDSRARFLMEAEVTGGLEHPGIVPVYGLGSYANGRPFYAMRFVRGDSLKDAIRRFHHSGKPQYDSLEFRQLLGRFIDVCQAIAYAHSRGVLHRDLKPGNVMLGRYGETLVVDWGLAKSFGQTVEPGGPEEPLRPRSGNDSSATAVGQAVGTLAYMSPEQADGRLAELGPATDVFSLGATLYDLLTGQPPFSSASKEAIRRGEFARPRQAVPTVPPALEAVCLKAMALEIRNRYPSPTALATEIERWLGDEAVQAYSDPPMVRLARWGRHHRTAVAAASVFLVTAVIALSISTLVVLAAQRRTAHEKEIAERERGRAETEHSKAESNFATARAVVVDISKRITEIETGQTDLRQMDSARLRILTDTARAFDGFRASNPDDEQVQREAARIHRYRANVARGSNDRSAAEGAYKSAIEISEALTVQFPTNPSHRDELSNTYRDKAMFLKRVGSLRDAAEIIQQAVEQAETLRGQLLDSAYHRTLGLALYDSADIEWVLGNFDRSEQLARQANELLLQLEKLPADETFASDPLFPVMAATNIAVCQRELGKTTNAIKSHRDAVSRVQKLTGPKAGPDILYWNYESRREQAKTWAGDEKLRDAAVRDLTEIIAGVEKLAADHPTWANYENTLAVTYLDRAEILAKIGEVKLATADLERSLAISDKVVHRAGAIPEYFVARGEAFHALSQLLRMSGRLAEAEVERTKAVKVFQAALKRDPDNFHLKRGLKAAEGR